MSVYELARSMADAMTLTEAAAADVWYVEFRKLTVSKCVANSLGVQPVISSGMGGNVRDQVDAPIMYDTSSPALNSSSLVPMHTVKLKIAAVSITKEGVVTDEKQAFPCQGNIEKSEQNNDSTNCAGALLASVSFWIFCFLKGKKKKKKLTFVLWVTN